LKKLFKIKNLPSINLIFLLIIIFFIIISCQTLIIPGSSNKNSNASNGGNPMKIIALVEIQIVNNQKDYILIEKPESKSRVSYHLIDLKKNQKEELEKLKGKMVEANIKVVQELSPWNKKAILLSIKPKN